MINVIKTISVVSRIFPLKVFGDYLHGHVDRTLSRPSLIYRILGQCAATSPRTQAYRRTSSPRQTGEVISRTQHLVNALLVSLPFLLAEFEFFNFARWRFWAGRQTPRPWGT